MRSRPPAPESITVALPEGGEHVYRLWTVGSWSAPDDPVPVHNDIGPRNDQGATVLSPEADTATESLPLMDHARRIPEDLTELERLLMQGASTIRQVEAAARLVLKVDNLREWLIKNHYLRMHMSESGPYAATYFAEAFAAVIEILRGGSIALEASGLTESSFSVLAVAANLSGRVENSIRYTVHEIDDRDAQAVAEAVLYAMGYMDATVDLYGNEVDDEGPNRLAYEKRLSQP